MNQFLQKTRSMFNKKRKGFTLIELVIVIGILAVLAVVSIRAFFGQGEGARNSQHLGYLQQIEASATQYMSEYGTGDLATFAEVNEEHALVKLNFIKAAKNPWAETAETWKAYKYYVGVVNVKETVGGVTKQIPKVVVVLGEDGIVDGANGIVAGKAFLQMDGDVPTPGVLTAGANQQELAYSIVNIK